MNHTIRTLVEKDWPAVKRIYEDGLATGLATFETEVPVGIGRTASNPGPVQIVVCLSPEGV